MSSPVKKKLKLASENRDAEISKRKNENNATSVKRLKAENIEESEIKRIQTTKRKNFIHTCERVSREAYFDFHTRLQLIYLPPCANGSVCKHEDNTTKTHIKEMPANAEEAFKIEMKTNMWLEALEVCQLSITPKQYLPPSVLKDIVEIIMNAHEDVYADYTITFLIEKCQQILAYHFSAHPPCQTKNIRKCYNTFLTSPMDLRDNTFTNRTEFEYDKGIVKYCLNRLEYEVSSASKDAPIVNKYEHVPEEMKQSVKGLHWQKEKFEIFESLDRLERIKRLIAVLESVIELLQFDLVIWHSRYTNNLGSHIMRSHKPLMAHVLWSNNVLYTGAVNNICRQVFRLFIYVIHLHYPEDCIRTMTMWLNTIFQIFYICESNSNSDYPNIGKYCTAFTREFHKILTEMPQKTIISVLGKIQPVHLQYLIGNFHIKTLLSTEEDDIIKTFITYLNSFQFKSILKEKIEIHISKGPVSKPINNILNYISKKCNTWKSTSSLFNNNQLYLKFDMDLIIKDEIVSQVDIIHIIYITLVAYLDAYNIQKFQETLNVLNEQLLEGNVTNLETGINSSSYSVTENFIKKYRSIFQMLKQLMLLLKDLKSKGELPEFFTIFEKIGLLES